jgi:hypothetical protein
MLRYIPSILSFLRAFIMKWCWILSKAFSAFIEMIKWFLSLLLLMCYIIFLICICWIISASLGLSWLGHGEWSFWFVVWFGLPSFYWGFCIDVHLGNWPIVLLFRCVLVWFWDESNAGFIEWVRQCSFPFCFVGKFKDYCY